mmetsp:Transcript_16740/g.20451  ORF Transcript_16740/g.20451 Transcript_16740/m.20451 type:complete len:149 (+) Transcript_16740:154-600(+)
MSRTKVLSTYRTLYRLIHRLPDKQHDPIQNIQLLRSSYRSNAMIQDENEINQCILKAGEKIAYLRIITPKRLSSSSSFTSESSSKRFIYTKDGVVELDGDGGGTKRDSNGRVISNWDGKNLDPCSIKTHNGQLKRMGFVNNLHAKGIF